MKAIYKDENGVSIELPKQTVEMYEIRERIKERAYGIDSFRLRYKFLTMALPADYLEAYLEGATFEECDITNLGVCYSTVCNAYDLPEMQIKMAVAKDVMNDMRPVMEMAKTVSDAAKGNGGSVNYARFGK